MPVGGLFLGPKGDGSPKELLRKLGVRNIAQYSAANVSGMPFPAFFSTDIHFFHTVCHVYWSMCPGRQARPRFGATVVRSAHDCESGLLAFTVVRSVCLRSRDSKRKSKRVKDTPNTQEDREIKFKY